MIPLIVVLPLTLKIYGNADNNDVITQLLAIKELLFCVAGFSNIGETPNGLTFNIVE